MLLTGTGVSYRFTAADAVTVEIRVSSDAVQVSGALPRVESAKYAAPLAETPQTIQVIPRTLLDEQGATTLTDALRNVPGITMQAGEGGGASSTSGDMFNMRGFSANNSLFVDGVRDDGLIARDVYNLEQIEVFSGPTGSDVGRTNAAGYINLATKTPNLEADAGGHAQLRRRRTGPRHARRQPAALASASAERSSATPRSASTRCGRTAASPAATTPRVKASRSPRRSPSASTRRRARASRARSCGRTTSPTTACRRRRPRSVR